MHTAFRYGQVIKEHKQQLIYNKNEVMRDKFLVVVHIIVLIGIYVVSYILSGQITQLASDIPKEIDFLRIILGGVLVILIFYLGARLYAGKVMKRSLRDFRIKMKKPNLFWVIVAIIIPFLVVLFYVVTDYVNFKNGQSDTYHTIRYFTRVLFIGGFTAAIMEEFFFRGVLMGYLEKKYGLLWAILIPSLLFGPPHLLNVENPSITLIIQFTLFALIFGIVVSLLVYYTNNIWNSISVHAAWNIITSFIIKQDATINSNFILQLKTKSLLLTGGEYGIGISVIGLAGYSMIGIILILYMRGIIRNKYHPKKNIITS